MGGKGEKLIPRKCKTENVPRNSTGMPASSDVRNGNDLLAEVDNAVQDVMNFVPAVEWDSMLANNDPVTYMTSTSEIGNNIYANDPKCSDPLTLSNGQYVGKTVTPGLCAELQFDPVVKLMGKGQCITLTEIEWKTLVCYRSIITNSFAGYATTPSYHEVCGVKITMEWMNKAKKVLKMQRAEETIYLAYDSVHEMWKLCDLIMTRLELLKRLEYKRYYDSIIDTIALKGGDVKEGIIRIVSKICVSEYSCITKELLIFGMDKILLDIDLREHVRVILFLDEFDIARVSRGAMLVRDLTYEWYIGAEHPLSIMFEAYGDGGHEFQYVDGVFQMNDCVIRYELVSELEDLRRRFEMDAEEVYDADTVMLEETLDYILPESSVSSPSSFAYEVDNLLEDIENNSDEEDREE
ncbi:hypothetical protein RN001_002309 [Aquatica leii]|uniref:Uncharacterized protein n=1 Tax=Aquatica leii TaxID=1421715 RepID=A0AAN7QNF2_9COLE|nr:hypothetical protein RN001_002309 [Aquatica leii]